MDRLESLPPKPQPPEESECCGQGCRSCVQDIYQQELLIWQKKCLEMKTCSVKQEIQMCKQTYVDCVIECVEKINSSVLVFQFLLPENMIMTLTAGQHVIAKETTCNGTISRPYTPISTPGSVERFSVLIKIYEEGKMSNIIRNKWLKGSSVAWRGPEGDCDYKPNTFSKIHMIAAGTGIAPMYQLAKLIVSDPDDETRVMLLYGCKTYHDILLRKELHEMQEYWNFDVRYFLSDDTDQNANAFRKHNEDITFDRITDKVVEKEIQDTRKGILRVYVCGPKEFENQIIKTLCELGVEKNSIVTF